MVKRILVVWVGISLMMPGLGYTQSELSIPKEYIPCDTPADVRVQIERLYSKNERWGAISKLGDMGEWATSAIPFLVEIMLNKEIGFLERNSTMGVLGRIKNKRAVNPLISVLEDVKDMKAVRYSAAVTLVRIGDD